VYARKASKRKVTHIIRRNRRCMGFKGNIGLFGLLRAFGVSSLRSATSGSAGSSAAAGEIGGAAVAYVGGSSSSLHEENKLWK
jgi:hypothetical protein